MKLDELKALLREMGVVGAGGAGFPTYGKLSDQADTLILNCAECEPLLKLHRQVLETYTYEILTAMNEILEATGASRGIVAIKSHYSSAVQALEHEIGDFPKLSVHKLVSVYPAGDELILIKEVTGKTVEPGNLPIAVGVTVCNVESVYNVYRAMKGAPVTHKYVTVAGEVKSPVTLRVPIGAKIAHLIDAAGGVTDTDVTYIAGGPMMGKEITPHDVVTKTTNAVLVLPTEHPVALYQNRNYKIHLRRAMSVCCQCRSCTDLCSRHVLGYPVEPHLVMRVLSNGGRGDVSALEGARFCSGCGLCESYSCPQNLSPKALIDEIKREAKKTGRPLPQGIKADRNVPNAAYKTVSVERLMSRLALTKYDVEAPLKENFSTDYVTVLLSQHIGAPSQSCVKEGDMVSVGDVIAKAADGALGVNIHASIDGEIVAVTGKAIRICARPSKKIL